MLFIFFFFFNDTATTEIYTLSLHDALPIWRVRINVAGCLDRCDEGPVLVIYPEGTWYTYVDQDDIDEIIESHIKNGEKVERLLI